MIHDPNGYLLDDKRNKVIVRTGIKTTLLSLKYDKGNNAWVHLKGGLSAKEKEGEERELPDGSDDQGAAKATVKNESN